MTEVLVRQAPQIILAAIAVVALLWLYPRHRLAALALVWATWFLLPLLRRLLDVTFGFTRLDFLSLLPFALTGLAALLELRSARPSRRALAIMGLAAGAFLVGIPAGLSQPVPLAFGLISYGGAMAAAVLGYEDVRRQAGAVMGSLGRTLLALAPAIAAYAVIQYYFLDMLVWDISWVTETGIRSLRSPEPGRLRAFSTLNSPVPFAAVMAVALGVTLATPRLRPYLVIAGLLSAIALALSYVRSLWVAVAVAVVVYLIAARSPIALLRVGAAAAAAAAIVAVGFWHPTVQAVISRGRSVAGYTEDASALARTDLVERVVPEAVAPDVIAGHGLGQSGMGAQVGGEGSYLLADNAYLAMVYQSGPIGLILILAALGALWVLAFQQVRRGTAGAPLHLALLTMFLIVGFFSDIFFGVVGAMLWYLAGRILASSDQLPSSSVAPATRTERQISTAI